MISCKWFSPTAVRRLGGVWRCTSQIRCLQIETSKVHDASERHIPRVQSSNGLSSDVSSQSVKPRNYWKHFLKSKRDHEGAASRVDIFAHEVNEALETYNLANQTNVTMDDVVITKELWEKLYPSRDSSIIVTGVDIIYLTSNGDGLCLIPRRLYAGEQDSTLYTVTRVPKAIPGDIVNLKLGRHFVFHADAELLDVTNARSRATPRKDRLIVCQNFNECSGCQLQMLSNDDQLEYKQSIIQRAFKFFCPELHDEVKARNLGHIIDSPMQYAYRTKITPHFTPRRDVEPLNTKIGFNNLKDPVGTVDINNCPIATPSINHELPILKRKVLDQLEKVQINKMSDKQRRKAKISPTLLLRDSIRVDHSTGDFHHVCMTNNSDVVTEKIGDFVFQFEASEFFQNNSFILPQLLEYIQFHISDSKVDFKYIVDTYCGSGFFGISLSKSVPEDGKIFGIEISQKSIKYAQHNAKLNGLSVPEKIDFISGSSEELFKNEAFQSSRISGDDSILIMDPSRKGSNDSFLKQLLEFGPRLIIYISCNPFSQARDLSRLWSLQENGPVQYKIKDVAGFDFFPQTKHVESVAILERCQV